MKNKAPLRTQFWSVILSLALLIAGLYFAYQRSGAFRSAFAPVVNTVDSMLSHMPSLPGVILSEPTTILFMGTDVSYSGQRGHLQRDASSFRSNTDTMMLGFFNPQAKKVAILHIPRDTEAYVGNSGIQKINSANSIGGPELSKTTVSSLLEVPVQHYLILNLQGLVQMVNELGGITLEVPKKLSYMDWTAKLKIDLEPGVHTLTGNQAMGFVRFRHDALGDIGRVQRQQIFMRAVIKKMSDPASWMHVPALLQIAEANIQTDMSQLDLVGVLNFVHALPRENIKFVMLPGQFSGNGDWIATADGRALASQLLNPDQEYVASRRNISVCVVNASSDRSFGSKLAQTLRKLGYVTSVAPDDADSLHTKTQIIVQNGNTANARMLQQDLGNVGDVVNASLGNLLGSITIIVHDDLNLNNVRMSSADAPYVAQPSVPPPIVAKWLDPGRTRSGKDKQSEENTAPPAGDENLSNTNTDTSQTGMNPDDFSHESNKDSYSTTPESSQNKFSGAAPPAYAETGEAPEPGPSGPSSPSAGSGKPAKSQPAPESSPEGARD